MCSRYTVHKYTSPFLALYFRCKRVCECQHEKFHQDGKRKVFCVDLNDPLFQVLIEMNLCFLLPFLISHPYPLFFSVFSVIFRTLVPVTQLYVSVDASTKDSLKKIDRPLFKDFWPRFLDSLRALGEKVSCPRRQVWIQPRDFSNSSSTQWTASLKIKIPLISWRTYTNPGWIVCYRLKLALNDDKCIFFSPEFVIKSRTDPPLVMFACLIIWIHVMPIFTLPLSPGNKRNAYASVFSTPTFTWTTFTCSACFLSCFILLNHEGISCVKPLINGKHHFVILQIFLHLMVYFSPGFLLRLMQSFA